MAPIEFYLVDIREVVETIYQTLRRPSDDETFIQLREAVMALPRYAGNTKGHWILLGPWYEGAGMGMTWGDLCECSECGYTEKFGMDGRRSAICPRCGADMRGADDEMR